jgi:hypothetical protein
MGHPSKHIPAFGQLHGANKIEDYSEFVDTDHETPALLVKGLHDLYMIWKNAGRIITDKFTIKYAAGMSPDSRLYYRDSRLPPTFKLGGKDVEYDFFFWIHELVETQFAYSVGRLKDSILIDQADLRNKSENITPLAGVNYAVAHQLAETIENAVVRGMGIDLAEYVSECDKWINWLSEQPLIKSPVGLSLYPIEDSGDLDLMHEIVATGGPESEFALPPGVRGGESGHPFNE